MINWGVKNAVISFKKGCSIEQPFLFLKYESSRSLHTRKTRTL